MNWAVLEQNTWQAMASLFESLRETSQTDAEAVILAWNVRIGPMMGFVRAGGGGTVDDR